MRSRSSLALAALALLGVAGCGSRSSARVVAPFVKSDGAEAGGSAVLQLGPYGTVLRFVPRTSFGIGFTLRNRSTHTVTVVAIRALDPAHGLVHQQGTRLLDWNPPPCTGHHSCPGFGFLHQPYGPERATALRVAPGKQAGVQLDFAIASCASVPTAAHGAAKQIKITYTTGGGQLQEQVMPLGDSRVLLRMPSRRDCAPRPKSTITVQGPFATGSDWTIPTSNGDTCTRHGHHLVFSSRLYETPNKPAVRILIRLPHFAGAGLYRTVGRPATARGPASVAALVGVGNHGRQTFKSSLAVITVSHTDRTTLDGRFHATVVGYRHSTFRAFGGWACRLE